MRLGWREVWTKLIFFGDRFARAHDTYVLCFNAVVGYIYDRKFIYKIARLLRQQSNFSVDKYFFFVCFILKLLHFIRTT